MIEEPDRYIDDFVDAGATMMSVHVEVLPHLHRTIAYIKSRGVKAGVVLNPSTPVSALEEIASDLDFVLVMSVNPGFGGQAFIPHSLEKVRRVRDAPDAAPARRAPIEIDGGIDRTNAADVVAAGASILVAGNAIFGTSDPEAATRALRAASSAAAGSRYMTRSTRPASGSATLKPTGWASSTTPTISSGSRWRARTGCARPAGPTARWSATASRCR